MDIDTARLAAFGGHPTPLNSQQVHLPTQHNLQPPLRDDELFDATDPRIDVELGDLDPETGAFLQENYARVAHPVLDSSAALHDVLQAWRACHNGLYRARHGQYLDGQDIYYLANRLVTWTQDQPEARLGRSSAGHWWILPDAYVFRIRFADSGGQEYANEETPLLGSDTGIFTPAEAASHRARFDQAKFTVHMVHFTNHWAVLIYQPSTGHSFYIDSSRHPKSERRRKAARDKLLAWLEASGRPAPRGRLSHFAMNKDQKDAWSCGLHVIANIMAFIRFEVTGWHKMLRWADMDTREVRKELVTCLHQLMGLRIDPDHHSPESSRRLKAAKKGLQPREGRELEQESQQELEQELARLLEETTTRIDVPILLGAQPCRRNSHWARVQAHREAELANKARDKALKNTQEEWLKAREQTQQDTTQKPPEEHPPTTQVQQGALPGKLQLQPPLPTSTPKHSKRLPSDISRMPPALLTLLRSLKQATSNPNPDEPNPNGLNPEESAPDESAPDESAPDESAPEKSTDDKSLKKPYPLFGVKRVPPGRALVRAMRKQRKRDVAAIIADWRKDEAAKAARATTANAKKLQTPVEDEGEDEDEDEDEDGSKPRGSTPKSPAGKKQKDGTEEGATTGKTPSQQEGGIQTAVRPKRGAKRKAPDERPQEEGGEEEKEPQAHSQRVLRKRRKPNEDKGDDDDGAGQKPGASKGNAAPKKPGQKPKGGKPGPKPKGKKK